MKFKRIAHIALALLIASAAPVASMAKGWETLKSERSDARTVVRESDLEIKAARGVIVVTTNHPLNIKVFTILGQLISSENIPAGTSQFAVSAHGVYIVKAGDLTCKIAL